MKILLNFHILALVVLSALTTEKSRAQSMPMILSSPRPRAVQKLAHSPLRDLCWQENSAAQGKWELKCSIETLCEKARDLADSNKLTPPDRLLIARFLRLEAIRKRPTNGFQNVFAVLQTQKPSDILNGEGFRDTEMISDVRHFDGSIGVPHLLPKIYGEDSLSPSLRGFKVITFSGEGRYLSETAPLVTLTEQILKPFLDAKGEPHPLASDAIRELFLILGETLRFDSARSLIERNALIVTQSNLDLTLLRQGTEWMDRSGAAPLRPWILKRLQELRPNNLTLNPTNDGFWMWLKSWEIESESEHRLSIYQTENKFRELALNFPDANSLAALKKMAESYRPALHVSWPPKSLTLNELETLVKSHLRNLDGNVAAKSLEEWLGQQTHSKPKFRANEDDAWEIFQLHARVLRLLDQREKIPVLFERYESLWGFLNPISPKWVKAQQNKHLSRMLELARLFWTYNPDPFKSLKVLDQILSDEAKYKLDHLTRSVLALKARVLEQIRRDDQALKAYELASDHLPEDPQLALDLLWRHYYFRFDRLKPLEDRAPLFKLLTLIRTKLPKGDAFELSKLEFSESQLRLLSSEDQDIARKLLRATYNRDPLSYFGNLAGLELIERFAEIPNGWSLAEHQEDSSSILPDGNKTIDYFSDSSMPAALQRGAWRLSLGESSGSSRALRELDKWISQKLFSNESNRSKKDALRYASAFRLLLDDDIGTLRMIDSARTSSIKDEIDGHDLKLLYPLAYWNQIYEFSTTESPLDPWLAVSLIRQESAFNPGARSPANALGLMQMIPPVAQAEAHQVGIKNFRSEQLYDPKTSLRLGIHHLHGLIESYGGSLIPTIASYNAGKAPVIKWLDVYLSPAPFIFVERISFQETRNYVRSILRNYMNYIRIYNKGQVHMADLMKLPPGYPGSSSPDLVNDKGNENGVTP